MEKLSFDRNIVQFYGAVLSGTAPMLILEYMEGDVPNCLCYGIHAFCILMCIACSGMPSSHCLLLCPMDLRYKQLQYTKFATAVTWLSKCVRLEVGHGMLVSNTARSCVISG